MKQNAGVMVLDQQERVEYVYDDGYVPTRGKGSYKPIKYVIDEKGCWICISHAKPKHRGGYPVIERNGKFYRMSRYIFEIENGYIDDDKFVMHSCDNPECINPAHLSLGTPKENTQDMIRKNRKPVGERVKGAKLTEEQVRSIFHDPRGCVTIAREYGVSKKTILNIKNGKSWKHLNLKKEEQK